MGVIDIINNHSDNDASYEKEIELFLEKRKELNELKKVYNAGDCNRKEIGKKLRQISREMFSILELFKIDLNAFENSYNYPNHISDYKKILELLLKISNENEEKYDLVKFNTYIIKKKETIEDSIWVLGRKDVLMGLGKLKKYESKYFRKQVTETINDGNSLVLLTEYEDDYNFIPFDCDIKDKSIIKNFKVFKVVGGLHTYTYDDELGSAINKLEKYIETYGGDVINISVDKILDDINNLNQHQKVYKR